MIKQFILGLVIFGAVALGIYNYATRPQTVERVTVEKQVGASQSQDHYNPEFFRNGLYGNLLYSLNTVSASSSSTTAPYITLALGSGAAGQFTIGTGTPATNVVHASTTAINAFTDMVFVQPIATTTIAGVTCNATPPTSTVVTAIYASSTNVGLNGFTVRAGSIPTTNPLCYNYWIVKKGN